VGAMSQAVRRHREAVLEAGERFFAARAAALANACWGMAQRFHRGGKLVIYAPQGPAFSDAQHNAVEFIHPVLVGKRALPAISARTPAQLRLLAGPDDIRLGITSRDLGELPAGLQVAFGDGGAGAAEHAFAVGAGDPLVAQEVQETAYHELWELVHVFFEHEGLLQEGGEQEACLTCGDVAEPAAVVRAGPEGLVRTARGEEECDLSLVDPVAPGELVMVHGKVALEKLKPIERFSLEFYPFLSTSGGGEGQGVPEVLADVARSVRMKWDEVAGLRRKLDVAAIEGALADLARRVGAGAKVLAFGNGGSATDAADLAADLLALGVPAIDLSGEPAVLTAVGNDIGFDEVFARQVIALGRPGDVAVALSTSGRSRNADRALEQAKRQGLLTLGLVGYGGGGWKEAGFLDHLLVVDSAYIPRIQEAQATIYHALVRGLEEQP
jgi:D-sedoheptulose 7-phosphate isomerase